MNDKLALRLRQAAAMLGISPRYLWGLAKRGEIPCVRLGHGKRQTLLFSVQHLQAWLDRQAQQKREGGAQ